MSLTPSSRSLEGHKDSVLSISFSPDSQTILTGSRDKTAKLWNLEGKVLATLKGHGKYVYTASFSPDGQTIATGSWDKSVILWDFNFNNLLTNTQKWQLLQSPTSPN